MSITRVYIDACAAVAPEGFMVNGGWTQWDNDQSGPADVKRVQVLSIPYPTFGKLVPADRLAFAAACLLFGTYPGCTGERVGICAAVPFGSLSTDLFFQRSIATIPSPALFSATLPSSVVSEIAIHFKIKGPNRVFVHDQGPFTTAMDAACRMISCGKADTMLVLYADVFEDEQRVLYTGAEPAPASSQAWVLLLTRHPRPEGLRLHTALAFRPAETVPSYSADSTVIRGIMKSSAPGGSGKFDIQYGTNTVTISTAKDD